MIGNFISELAAEAGMSFDKYHMAFAIRDHAEDGVDLDKFAELLVRKCADIAANTHPDDLPFIGGNLLTTFGYD